MTSWAEQSAPPVPEPLFPILAILMAEYIDRSRKAFCSPSCIWTIFFEFVFLLSDSFIGNVPNKELFSLLFHILSQWESLNSQWNLHCISQFFALLVMFGTVFQKIALVYDLYMSLYAFHLGQIIPIVLGQVDHDGQHGNVTRTPNLSKPSKTDQSKNNGFAIVLYTKP
jgi:hypothetical protein